MYSSACECDYSTKKVNSALFILLTIYLQQAMSVVGFNSTTQSTILKLVSAILHLGNINFKEENNVAVPVSDNSKYKSSPTSYRSLRLMSSLRKQPTFYVTIKNFPAKCRPRNARNNPTQITYHYPSLGSAWDGWSKFLSRHKQSEVQGSDKSTVWSSVSQASFRGENHWWRRGMSGCFPRLLNVIN